MDANREVWTQTGADSTDPAIPAEKIVNNCHVRARFEAHDESVLSTFRFALHFFTILTLLLERCVPGVG